MIEPGTCPHCKGATVDYDMLMKMTRIKDSKLDKYGVYARDKQKDMKNRVWRCSLKLFCMVCHKYFTITIERGFKKDRAKNQVQRMEYKCRRCGISFRDKKRLRDARIEVINNIAGDRHCLIIAHNCFDGGVGVADLQGAD